MPGCKPSQKNLGFNHMKILVTGGAGFIASHIVDAYLKARHEVIVIDNLVNGYKENVNPAARYYQLDICSQATAQLIREEKPAVLNHHAAKINARHSVETPKNDLDVNVGGTLNLLEACKDIGLKRFIFSSTGGAMYGDNGPIPSLEMNPENPLSPYGINKFASEKYVAHFSRLYGFPFTCFRYGNIYGPRQNPDGEAGVVAIFISRILAGLQPTIYGDGTNTRDYTYVQDVVKLNLMALDRNLNGIFNVGTGIETDVNQIYRQIASLLDYPYPPLHGPANRIDQLRSCLSADLLKKIAGFAPDTLLIDGLKETVEWFKKSS